MLGLIVVLLLVLLVSARLSLDHEFEHTSRTKALPLLVPSVSYASLSILHPSAIGAANAADSIPSYVRFFQKPGLAERLLFALDSRLLRGMYSEMPPELLTEYLAVFSETGQVVQVVMTHLVALANSLGEIHDSAE